MGGNETNQQPERETQKRMPWFKIWADPWFDSSMRVELTNDERGIWLDLLALACRSRFPGVIASGRDSNGEILGYPLKFITAKTISWSNEQIENALKVLQATGRISITETPLRTGETGLIISIISWKKWQSEYARTKEYYEKNRSKRVTRKESLTRELNAGAGPERHRR